MKYLIERASAITPKDSLDDLLKNKKSLRIKLGVDPTAPDVTLGWYAILRACLLYTSPSPRDAHESRMPSSA